MKSHWIASALLSLAACAAHADVQVSFVKPDTFSDIKDNHGFRRLEILDDIKAYLVVEIQKRLPGRDVRLEVTDVDLAGEYEPFAWRGQGLRVMRSYTSPAIEFSYEVREGGQVVKQGQARLRDMGYQDGFNSFTGSDPLRYEKRMLEQWMKREFGTAVAAVPAR